MTKIRAHVTSLRSLGQKEEALFLEKNHLQGYTPSSLCYGLFYNGELVELMSFGKPRFNRRYDWELLRLCTKKDCIVYGGASKLFKYFESANSGSVISYCNLSLFSGDVYEKMGFKLLNVNNGYHYEKEGIEYNRMSFQKWKCLEKWPEYKNTDKTEKEIMTEKGFNIVEEKQAAFVYGVKWYIYEITNKVNGKTYIGQHLDRGDKYFGSGNMIKAAIKKYGLENFEKRILKDDIQSQKDADYYELFYIKEAKSHGKAEYNILTRKTPHSQYTVAPKGLLHIYNNGLIEVRRTVCPEGFVEGFLQGHLDGLKYEKTKEQKTKISEGLKGHTPWNKGLQGVHKTSDETREKISKALKGKKKEKYTTNYSQYTPERAIKISEAKKGKKRGCWWNNGISNTLAFECPGDGWTKGMLQNP